MEIKKLETKDLDQGLTLEFVNGINFKKSHSPVMFDFKDDAVKTLKCNGGFWVSVGFGEFLKDKKDEIIIFSEREIRIARARYLFKNPEIDKPIINKKIQPEYSKPLFSARYDNPEEMQILKNVFSVDALEKADFNISTIKENLAKEQLSSFFKNINKDS